MSSIFKGMILIGLFGVLEVGCVAQKADIARIQKDLEQQIDQIKSEKAALIHQMKETRSTISDSRSLIADQKSWHEQNAK